MLKRILYCVLSVLLFAGAAFGESRWDDGFSGNSLWDEPQNWQAGSVPATSDSTFVRNIDLVAGGQWPIIDEFTNAVCRRLSLECSGMPNPIGVTMTGGTLDIYYGNTSDCYLRLGAGSGPGAAVFNMSGGTMTIKVDEDRYTPGSNGYIRVGSGYTGQLNLSGDSLVEAFDLLILDTDGTHVDLRDNAKIILAGDDTAALQGYINDRLLTGYNNPALVDIEYFPPNPSDPNLSDITVITALSSVTSFDPSPGDGDGDVDPNTDLSWIAGTDTLSHNVYFGDDEDAVANATTASPEFIRNQTETSIGQVVYHPSGWLDLNKTYYWRIDDVKNGTTETGPVWQFTVANFLRVSDGLQIDYDNTAPPYTTEAQLDFTPPMDWTLAGVKFLQVAFTGNVDNDPNEQLYITVAKDTPEPNSVTLVYEDMSDPFGVPYDNTAIAAAATSTWQIPLQDFVDAGIDLQDIGKVIVGLGDGVGPGIPGTGTLIVDNIRLYPPQCYFGVGPAGGDVNNDCVVNLFDLGIMAANWLSEGFWP